MKNKKKENENLYASFSFKCEIILLDDFTATEFYIYHRLRVRYLSFGKPLTSKFTTLQNIARARGKSLSDALNRVLKSHFYLEGNVYKSEKLDEMLRDIAERKRQARLSAFEMHRREAIKKANQRGRTQ